VANGEALAVTALKRKTFLLYSRHRKGARKMRIRVKYRVSGLATALLVSASAYAQPASPRPPAELHCVYDGVSPETRDAVGQAFWSGGRTGPQPAELLGPTARACMRRHRWGVGELEQASRYAMGAATIRYTRTRMAAMGISMAGWDKAYEDSPVAERVQTPSPPTVRDRAMAAISLDQSARDPNVIAHSATYFAMRTMVERSERWWSGIPLGK
jgi:hypothetical protein